MGRRQEDLEVGARLRKVVRRNLGIDIEYIGFVAQDDQVGLSVAQRHPYVDLAPDTAFARTLGGAAKRLIETPVPETPQLFEDDEDMLIR